MKENAPLPVFILLRTAIEESTLSYQEIADSIGLSKTGLFQSIKLEALKLKDFQAVCKVIGISASDLLQSTEQLNSQNPETRAESVHMMKMRLELAALKKRVDALEGPPVRKSK